MLSENTEKLIQSVKMNNSLNDVRFIKAHNGRSGDKPIMSPLVTVQERAFQISPFVGGYIGDGSLGEKISYELLLNIYCPYGSGGDGISIIVNSIREALCSVDAKSVAITEINYSKEYEAIYRSMIIGLECIRKGDAIG